MMVFSTKTFISLSTVVQILTFSPTTAISKKKAFLAKMCSSLAIGRKGHSDSDDGGSTCIGSSSSGSRSGSEIEENVNLNLTYEIQYNGIQLWVATKHKRLEISDTLIEERHRVGTFTLPQNKRVNEVKHVTKLRYDHLLRFLRKNSMSGPWYVAGESVYVNLKRKYGNVREIKETESGARYRVRLLNEMKSNWYGIDELDDYSVVSLKLEVEELLEAILVQHKIHLKAMYYRSIKSESSGEIVEEVEDRVNFNKIVLAPREV